jgi:hypothetical protein
LLLLLLEPPARLEVVRVGRNDELKDAHSVWVVVDKRVIGVLKGSLNLADVVGAPSDVNLRVLRVLDGEFVARPLIVALPTSVALGEVETFLSDGNPDLLIVEVDSVKLEEIDQMLSQVHLFCRTVAEFVLSLEIAGSHHGEKEWADAPVVRLIELSWFEETFQDNEQRLKLWVLFQQMLNELHAVNTVGAVERDVHVDAGLPVLQLDDWHLGMLERIYGLADPWLQQLVSEFVDHVSLLHIWQVHEEVDIGVGQVEPSCTRPENHYTSVGIALPHYVFHSSDHLFADLQILGGRLNEPLEVQNLIVQEYEGVLDLKCEITDPWVLISVVLLRNTRFNVVDRVTWRK